jgi:hypothetical protein
MTLPRRALGFLSCLPVLASCATHTDQRCVCPAQPSAVAVAEPTANANAPTVPTTDTSLAKALLAGIPRPAANQFPSPESAMQFLFQQVATRNMVEALRAYPVVEHYERVKLKDYAEYVGHVAASQYPLDDDWYGRLSRTLASYLTDYRMLALRILTDNPDRSVSVTSQNMPDFLRELDGSRLKALRVVSIKPTDPAKAPEINSIERAIGITEKKYFDVILGLESREVKATVVVGRLTDNWRVLHVTAL